MFPWVTSRTNQHSALMFLTLVWHASPSHSHADREQLLEMDILDPMIRGGGTIAGLTLSFFFLLHAKQDRTAKFGVWLGLSAASYHICTAPWAFSLPPVLLGPLFTLCICNPLSFWLFAHSLFNDGRALYPVEKGVVVSFLILVALHLATSSENYFDANELVAILLRILGLLLAIQILYESFREYTNDLLETRRKLRIYLLILIGFLTVFLLIGNIFNQGAIPQGLHIKLNLIALTAMTIVALLAFVHLQADLFPAWQTNTYVTSPENSSPQDSRPTIDQAVLQKLIHEMETNKAYRDETLTIINLAKKLGTQEYLLRRTINKGLGHRNFTNFLNKYRLADVEQALKDPQQTGLPILTIALDAGFNSIGPFNRAFKDKHFMTPSEYRKTQQNNASEA